MGAELATAKEELARLKLKHDAAVSRRSTLEGEVGGTWLGGRVGYLWEGASKFPTKELKTLLGVSMDGSGRMIDGRLRRSKMPNLLFRRVRRLWCSKWCVDVRYSFGGNYGLCRVRRCFYDPPQTLRNPKSDGNPSNMLPLLTSASWNIGARPERQAGGGAE